jgi:hypothetical protein
MDENDSPGRRCWIWLKRIKAWSVPAERTTRSLVPTSYGPRLAILASETARHIEQNSDTRHAHLGLKEVDVSSQVVQRY